MTGNYPHGTLRRYRLELRDGGAPCEACKAANAAHARLTRENRIARNTLTLVSDEAPTSKPPPPRDPPPKIGPVERAARAEMALWDRETSFVQTLTATAVKLAREIDEASTQSAAIPARQLLEVIREMKKKGGPAGDTFDAFLRELSAPVVSPPVRNKTKPE